MSSTSDKPTCSVPQASPEAIDASCRWPVLILFTGGAGWLVLSTLLGFLATMKFHMPGMFAKCEFFSYGRLVASSQSLLIYGFGVSVAMGIAMWLMARAGKAKLVGGLSAVIGAHFWHAGVLIMWIMLAFGGLTGHEWFEVPKPAAALLFASYIVLALPVIQTLAARVEKRLEPEQWFIMAALFWFAWIFATACFLIHCHPASGIVQVAVQYWYGHNLVWIFFGFISTAVIFHLLPKFAGNELFSRELAAFSFWTMLLIASLGGVPHGIPLPAWLPSIAAMSAALMLIPVGAVAYNCHMTMGGRFGGLGGDPVRTYVLVGSAMLVVGSVALALDSVRPFSDMVGLTLFTPALSKLLLHGFIGLTFFGAILYVAPKVAGGDWPVPKAVNVQFGCTVLGCVLAAGFLAAGGIKAGYWSLDAATVHSNEDIEGMTRRFIQMSTTGDLILLVGHIALLLNLKLLCYRQCRACCASVCCGASGKTAEVTA